MREEYYAVFGCGDFIQNFSVVWVEDFGDCFGAADFAAGGFQLVKNAGARRGNRRKIFVFKHLTLITRKNIPFYQTIFRQETDNREPSLFCGVFVDDVGGAGVNGKCRCVPNLPIIVKHYSIKWFGRFEIDIRQPENLRARRNVNSRFDDPDVPINKIDLIYNRLLNKINLDIVYYRKI